MDQIPDFNGGDWLKLHRKIIDSEVFKSPVLLQLFIWFLVRANYKTRFFNVTTGNVGCNTVKVNAGQFLFGRKSAARELGMTEDALRWRMKKLVDKGMIVDFCTHQYSIISICNWPSYQSVSADEHPSNTQATPNEHPTNTHRQEGKEGKEGKEVSPAGGLTPKIQNPIQPTLEEVTAYCSERLAAGNPRINPAQFHAHYASVGWMDKKGQQIRNWRAFVWKWELNAHKYDNKPL